MKEKSESDGRIAGCAFLCLNGRTVYSIFMGGAYFGSDEAWRELMEPKLEVLEGYDPWEKQS